MAFAVISQCKTDAVVLILPQYWVDATLKQNVNDGESFHSFWC